MFSLIFTLISYLCPMFIDVHNNIEYSQINFTEVVLDHERRGISVLERAQNPGAAAPDPGVVDLVPEAAAPDPGVADLAPGAGVPGPDLGTGGHPGVPDLGVVAADLGQDQGEGVNYLLYI